MIKLTYFLGEFVNAQLMKFLKRQDRNKGANVCDDSLDWTTINWEAVEAHFLREIKEFIKAPSDPDELIDIANMSFLLWFYRSHIKKWEALING